MGGCGDGGLVTSHDPALHQQLVRLRGHGAGEPRYMHHAVGGNFRLDAMQAALLRLRLADLPQSLARRQAHAKRYVAAFAAAGSVASGAVTWAAHAAHESINQFVVRLPAPGLRDRVAAALAVSGIASAVYYPLPLHLQPCFAHLGYRHGDLPHSEAAAIDSLALPIAPELTDDDIERVAHTVIKTLRPPMARRAATAAQLPRPPTPPSLWAPPPHNACATGPLGRRSGHRA